METLRDSGWLLRVDAALGPGGDSETGRPSLIGQGSEAKGASAVDGVVLASRVNTGLDH